MLGLKVVPVRRVIQDAPNRASFSMFGAEEYESTSRLRYESVTWVKLLPKISRELV